MKSAIFEYLAMKVRGSPVSKIKKNRTALQNAGFEVSASELEAHFLAGGRIDEVTQLLLLAKEAGKNLTYMDACVVDLVSKTKGDGCLPYLERSIDRRTFEFSTFGKDDAPIAGITMNKERVEASVSFTFYYPVTALDFDDSFRDLRNRFGSLISAEIHSSRNIADFGRRKDDLVDELTRISKEFTATIDGIEIETN